MQPYATQPHYGWNTVVVIVIAVALLVWRNLRPQKISVTRLFVTPVLLAVVVAYTVFIYQSLAPAPVWEVVAALVVGALAGVPMGLLRGKHSNVRATDRANVMILEASWQTFAIYAGAFVVRYLLRVLFPPFSPAGTAIGDGVLAFAAAMILVSYYAIYMKYRALETRAQFVAETPAV
ncbi:MAG TPA: hypothetical protein VIG32_10385 [Candidatus Baltobacteraceae bacterium]|jgi:hypothetical protein